MVCGILFGLDESFLMTGSEVQSYDGGAAGQ